MAVMARETWTDERLDDLNKRVGDGFSDMREEFRALRAEIHQLTYGLIGTMLLGFLGTIVAIVTQI
ncbi:MAG TPA: hypothetical protein VFR75_11705 [Solirubrobacterales bacterium]|nr:hypothetical protein [Solirubrobacterales bacterium]